MIFRALVLAVLLFAGCGVVQPAIPLERFTAGDLGVVADFAREQATAGEPENLALVLNVLADCELLQGGVEAARRHYDAAARIMGNWQTSGSETFAAVAGSEASKDYKGDPYEKAMNAFFLGLCYALERDYDNARAAFKKGILADGESSDERYQVDFTLLFWLAGRMSRLMGLPQDAADFYAEATKADAFARAHGSRASTPNQVLANPGAGNLVVLVGCGMGPEKYAAGDEGELARFRPRWSPVARAQVWIDGRLAGPTDILVDVDYQARTRGGTEMEGIRKGKAVLKSVTRAAGIGALWLAGRDERRKASRDKFLVGAGLLLFSALTSSEADVRHWSTLPSTVQAFTADVAPGLHSLRVDFLDARGRVLGGLTQSASVRVADGRESYSYFRSLPQLDRSSRELR